MAPKDSKDVLSLIPKKHLAAIWHVVLDPNTSTITLLVRAERVTEKASGREGHISSLQLIRLCNRLQEKLGQAVESSYVDYFSGNLEKALEDVLRAQFPNLLEECYVSIVRDGEVAVWLRTGESDIPAEVESVVRSFLSSAALSVVGLRSLGGGQVPSRATVLRMVKTLSPVLVSDLIEELEKKGFEVPNERWVARTLDTLRRKGFLSRIAKDKYSVTAFGLAVVPHGSSRTSSDVERILALGRRRWDD